MADNPFKIIEPREQLPESMKDDVMSSVKTAVLVLRFVQLFVGDYASMLLGQFRTSRKNQTPDSE